MSCNTACSIVSEIPITNDDLLRMQTGYDSIHYGQVMTDVSLEISSSIREEESERGEDRMQDEIRRGNEMGGNDRKREETRGEETSGNERRGNKRKLEERKQDEMRRGHERRGNEWR